MMLDIGYKRLCSCRLPNAVNCLDRKKWFRLMFPVWRDICYSGDDTAMKKLHPATFPSMLAERVVELFSHRGELILDPFAGIGTSLLAANKLERNAVGTDLKQEYVDITKTRLSERGHAQPDGIQQIALCDDAMNAGQYIANGALSLIWTSPPYANMLNRKRKNVSKRQKDDGTLGAVEQYSQDERDLGTMEAQKFTDVVGQIFARLLPLLKPRGHCVVNITDIWIEGQRVPLHVMLINKLQEVGYVLQNIMIWDREKMVQGSSIFGYPSHFISATGNYEYIIDFWRPITQPTACRVCTDKDVQPNQEGIRQ